MAGEKSEKIQYKILVVEDNPSVLKVLKKTLDLAGYQVLEAADGKSAVERMAENPDLVIQDLILPDISGYDLVSKLKARSEKEKLPVLALSGFLARPNEAWDTSAGFDALLVKPVGNTELLQAVKAHLSGENNAPKP